MSIGSSILRPLFGSVRTLGISKCCKRPYSVTVLKGELCKINLSSIRWYSKSRNAGNENVSDTIVAINDDTLEDEPIVLDVVKEQSRISDGLLSSKYTEFRDEDAQVILDVEEERLIAEMQASMAAPSLGELEGISLERSVHGVFHTAEIVSILNSQKAQDVAVIELPSELGYADHMVIVSGRSSRHLLSMATFIRLVYKKKVLKDNSHAKIPVIEGKSKKNENWLALDLGNIVVHFFTKETREKYDLESLWALGPEFDPLLNNVDQDPVTTIMNKHSIYLGDLKPADSNL